MRHKFILGEDGFCDAWLPSGYNKGLVLEARCGYPEGDECHEALPPVRNPDDRRPRERQDF